MITDLYNLPSNKVFLISQKAFIVNKDKVLLLKHSLHKDSQWSGLMCIPGGLLEVGEDLEEGIKREILEETGLSVIINKRVGFADFDYLGFQFKGGKKKDAKIIQLGYECELIDKSSDKVSVSDEHCGYDWVSTSDLEKYEYTLDSKGLVEYYIASRK